MKQVFYLNQYSNGDTLLSTRENSMAAKVIGTIELDVQPIRKEVEKVIGSPTIMRSVGIGVQVVQTLPPDAYDVKVSFKVKE